jgi:hypothetical protein
MTGPQPPLLSNAVRRARIRAGVLGQFHTVLDASGRVVDLALVMSWLQLVVWPASNPSMVWSKLDVSMWNESSLALGGSIICFSSRFLHMITSADSKHVIDILYTDPHMYQANTRQNYRSVISFLLA